MKTKAKNLILNFLKANRGGEFTVVEITKAIKDAGEDYINYYTESTVAFELKEGLADVKFIHSRETASKSFAYEAFTYRKGSNSRELDFSSRPDGKTTRADLVENLTIVLNNLLSAREDTYALYNGELSITELLIRQERIYGGAVSCEIGRLTAMVAFAKGEDVN